MCDRDHYLDAKWKLRIGTDFVIVGHGSYWSSHGELLVWFPFCPFWFAISIYDLSFFLFFSSFFSRRVTLKGKIPLRQFFCMSPSTWTAWPSQQYEDWVWWYLRISKCMDFLMSPWREGVFSRSSKSSPMSSWSALKTLIMTNNEQADTVNPFDRDVSLRPGNLYANLVLAESEQVFC